MDLWGRLGRIAFPSRAHLRELNRRLQETIEAQARTAALLRESEARALAIAADLERREAEHAIAESALRDGEARMRLAFEAARLGVWEMDFANNVGRLDPRAAVMTAKDLPAETWLPLDGPELAGFISRIHPDDLPARAEAINAIRVGTTDVVQMEYRVRREDGADWTWLTHWRAVIDRDPATGKPTRAVGVILDSTERARVEASLRDALSQRDLLLREVYHRVKNNLQIVDGLLVLQSRSLEDPRAIEVLAGLRSRIYALGLVHSQLMTSKNLETFDIAPFLRELAQNIVAGGGGTVAIQVEACPLEVGLDFAVPVGLLVTELVTNCLKHGLHDVAGTIRVVLNRDAAGDVVLIVADDGPGASLGPAAASVKPGVGASIISGLVKQLSGIVSVRDDAGHVTTITIPATEFA